MSELSWIQRHPTYPALGLVATINTFGSCQSRSSAIGDPVHVGLWDGEHVELIIGDPHSPTGHLELRPHDARMFLEALSLVIKNLDECEAYSGV